MTTLQPYRRYRVTTGQRKPFIFLVEKIDGTHVHGPTGVIPLAAIGAGRTFIFEEVSEDERHNS